MRWLGVDTGSRRIGLALSDEDGWLAYPLVTVPHTNDAEALDAVAAEANGAQVDGIVVGLPVRLDGTEGEAARLARAFAKGLGARGLSVVLWDERLTTVAAERALSHSKKRGAARRAVVDQVAATILLQSYLDSRRDEPCTAPEPEALRMRRES